MPWGYLSELERIKIDSEPLVAQQTIIFSMSSDITCRTNFVLSAHPF